MCADGVARKHHFIRKLFHCISAKHNKVENIFFAVTQLHFLGFAYDKLPEKPVMFKAFLSKTVFFKQREYRRTADNKKTGDCGDNYGAVSHRQQVIEYIGGKHCHSNAGVAEYRVEHRMLSVHCEIYYKNIRKNCKASLPYKSAYQEEFLFVMGKIRKEEQYRGKRHEAYAVDVEKRYSVEFHKEGNHNGCRNIGNVGVKTVILKERDVHLITESVDSS